MKESNIDRVFSPSEDEQKKVEKVFERTLSLQELVVFQTEREKTPEELEIIKFLDKETNEIAHEFIGAGMEISHKYLHIISEDEFDDNRRRESPEREIPNAFYSHKQQAIIMKNKDLNLANFTKLAAHEMLHMKSYQSYRTNLEKEPGKAFHRRTGPSITSRENPNKDFFPDLNEAITEYLVVRMIRERWPENRNDLPQALKEKTTHFSQQEFIDQFGDVSYVGEQLSLMEIMDKVIEKNPDEYKTREDVLKIFGNAYFAGHILKLRKIIDQTYGNGSFVEFAEEGLPKSKWEIDTKFKRQFAKTDEIEVLGEKIGVVDIIPEKPKSDVPVLIAPGWGENQDVFMDSLKTLFSRNKRALSLTHSRRGGNAEAEDGELKDKYPADKLRKAMALLKAIEEKNIEKVDVIAHSEGGINTAIAASIKPEKFRNIVFVNSAGMIGKDNFPKLAGRFSMSLIKDAAKFLLGGDKKTNDRLMRAGKETAKYIGQNPLRAVNEAINITKSEIQNMLKDLKGKGIGIGVINGVDDPVFPMDKMQKILKPNQLDGFISVKGGHNEIYANPERYTVLADEMLDSLEKKKNSVK